MRDVASWVTAGQNKGGASARESCFRRSSRRRAGKRGEKTKEAEVRDCLLGRVQGTVLSEDQGLLSRKYGQFGNDCGTVGRGCDREHFADGLTRVEHIVFRKRWVHQKHQASLPEFTGNIQPFAGPHVLGKCPFQVDFAATPSEAWYSFCINSAYDTVPVPTVPQLSGPDKRVILVIGVTASFRRLRYPQAGYGQETA
jgi:hypothetical protein